jgi:polysaccharide export outer membrane protein
MDVEEIGQQPYVLDLRGEITLPMAGRIKASGMTAEELEKEIAGRLKAYLKEPQVTVAVAEMKSQPVMVMGSVAQPGIVQLQGKKTLFEVISMAGGFRQDAGPVIRVARRKKDWGEVPLTGAKDDATGEFSVGEVWVQDVVTGSSPALNIKVLPNDVITVPKAEVLYVLGNVKKSGGFLLGDRQTVTALQALSMAEGFAPFAKSNEVKVLRKTDRATERQEIVIRLKDILDAKVPDVLLQPEDIMYVPEATGKKVGAELLRAGVQVATGVAVWGLTFGRDYR